MNRFTLVLHCPNVLGIVYQVSKFLFQRGANITESAQYDDEETDRFFMRVAFAVENTEETRDALASDFEPIARDLQMTANFYPHKEKTRVLILASQWTHCLADLLHRHSSGDLEVDIVGVVSNHSDAAAQLANKYAIPFDHLDTGSYEKAVIEQKLMEIMQARQVELMVLARYMQILSENFCEQSPCPIINIHHSFLPSFKGARPYHQAFARGVKIVGATAHYVTADLDEGPIIEQDVARVNHSLDAQDLMEIGRDLENSVLARAVKLHVRHRVLPNGPRTVVFA